MFEKEAEEKYCKGCKSRIEQCLWAWRNTNGLNELKNCSCKEVPNYIRGAIDGYNKAKNDSDKMKSRFLELCNLKDMRIKELEKAKEEHLSKAKEIIERLVEGIRIISDPKIYMTDVDTFVSEAEQFLEEN